MDQSAQSFTELKNQIKQSGHTLVELLFVLVILGALTALASFPSSESHRAHAARIASEQLVNILNQSEALAYISGREVRVRFTGNIAYRSVVGAIDLSKGVEEGVFNLAQPLQFSNPRFGSLLLPEQVVFRPDGTASPGSVRIGSKNTSCLVNVGLRGRKTVSCELDK